MVERAMSGDWQDSTEWQLDIGRYENKERIKLPVPGLKGGHWVVAGSSHSGKTETIRLALARMTVQLGPLVAFAVADPHMVGYMDFVPRASMIGYGRGEVPLKVFGLVEAEMRRRLAFMKRHGIIKWTPEHSDLIGPYLLLVVDEVAAITLMPARRLTARERAEGAVPEESAEVRLIFLAQEIRKVGGGLILAAQSPKVRVIHGLILEQCPIRWCGRTRRREQTEAILETSEYPCHLADHPKGCSIGMPGTAYVDDGVRVRRGRSTGIEPDVFARIAREHAADRFDGFGWPHEIQSGLPAGEREEVNV